MVKRTAAALTGLALLGGCAPGPVSLTSEQRSEFAERLAEPDPLASGQIPAAPGVPGR